MNPDKMLSEAEIDGNVVREILEYWTKKQCACPWDTDPAKACEYHRALKVLDALEAQAKLAIPKPRQDAGRPTVLGEDELQRAKVSHMSFQEAAEFIAKVKAWQAYALTLEAKPQPQDHLHSCQDGHWQIFYDGDNPDCPLCEVKEAKSAKEGG